MPLLDYDILDLTLTELHQRTPLFIGNRENVAAVTAALSADRG